MEKRKSKVYTIATANNHEPQSNAKAVESNDEEMLELAVNAQIIK